MRVLVVHNRYWSALPTGENAVVDEETSLLAEHGCDVERIDLDSDSIAAWSLAKRASLPFRVVWSREGARLVRDAIERFRPDIVHAHNTFPLFSLRHFVAHAAVRPCRSNTAQLPPALRCRNVLQRRSRLRGMSWATASASSPAWVIP